MIYNPEVIKLPKIVDLRGNLSFIQFPNQLSFEIKRAYWSYDLPSGKNHDGCAYFDQYELLIALSGSFFVNIHDENNKIKIYYLNRSDVGLIIPPLTWRVLNNFSTNALAFHLSSHIFSESKLINDYEVFKKLKIEKNNSI